MHESLRPRNIEAISGGFIFRSSLFERLDAKRPARRIAAPATLPAAVFGLASFGQSPIGLLTLAMPPFFGVHTGAAVSLPEANEPLVAFTVTTLPAFEQPADASPPAPEAEAVALQGASVPATASAPSLAVALPVPSVTKVSASLTAPLASAAALPPPPSTSASAVPS